MPANTVKPTASDDVIFDTASGACNLATTAAVCRSVDFTGAGGVLPYTDTFTWANVLWTVGTSTAGPGNVAVKWPSAGWTLNATGGANARLLIQSTAAANQTVDIGGKTLPALTTTPNATTGTYTLSSGYTVAVIGGSTGITSHTRGTLDVNGQTLALNVFQISGGDSLVLGAADITCAGSGSAWNWTAASATLSKGTSTIRLTGNSSFIGAGKAYATVIFTGTAIPLITGSNSFDVLTRTGQANMTSELNLTSGTTQTIGTLNATGNDGTVGNRLLIRSSTLGAAATIAVAAIGTLTDVNFRDITATGAASPLTGTSLGDAWGNTGITTDTPKNRYIVIGGNWNDQAIWSATNGGAGGASIPLPQDTANIIGALNANVTSNSIPIMCRDLICSGSIGRSLTFAGTSAIAGSANFTGLSSISGGPNICWSKHSYIDVEY